MSFDELMQFYNSIIINDYEIENAYYFKNFLMLEEYNQYDTCSIVSLALLLGYYDTFYNGTLINDSISYINKNDFNCSIDTMYNCNFTSDFLFKTWETDPQGTQNLPVVTLDFHDYLVDLAEQKNIIKIKERTYSDGSKKMTCGGINDFQSQQILKEYFISNNMSTDILNLFIDYNLTSINLLNLLNSGIPLRLIIENYDFYYIKDGKVYGKKTTNTSHSVIAYGYIQNEYGTFLKTNFGYENYGECYVDINYVNSYSYYEYNGNHECSNNYHFNYDSSDLNAVIDMCPYHPYEYYFTHTGYTVDENGNEVHNFIYNFDSSIEFSLNHVMKNYDKISTNHIKKCIFYDYCNESEIEQHYTGNNKYELLSSNLTDSSNFSGHYLYCS